MAAHTPESWIVAGEPNYAHVSGGNPQELIADCACGRARDIQDRANARLIAAAPDLLAALSRCTDLLAPYADEEDPADGTIGAAMRAARAALMRAGV